MDRLCSLLALLVLAPFFLIIALWIKLDSPGRVIYSQQRIGRNGVPFALFKFRTMRPASRPRRTAHREQPQQQDHPRGYVLRKYKMDELPQLLNVLKGEMSIVGPRPEVEKYVRLYTAEQLKVLAVKPGLTDLASLEYFEESKLLAQSADPEQTYIKEIMPAKLGLNRRYIDGQSLWTDLGIIFRTLIRIVEKLKS